MADRVQKVEAAFRTLRVLRLVGDLGDFREIALGEPKYALGIVGARDLVGHPGLVIADIGPAETILEHAILEEFTGEIDRLGGLVGIDGDGFPVRLHLGPTVGPQQRINPAVVVAEAVSELEAEGMVLRFQFLADLVELFPGVGEFRDPDLLEIVGPPVHQLADIAERNALPFAVDEDRLLACRIPAALRLSGLLGDIGDVEIFIGEQERHQRDVHRDVRPRAGLGDSAGAGRQAADTG